MSNLLKTSYVLLLCVACPTICLDGHELAQFGTLPVLPPEWEVSPDDKQTSLTGKLPFSWIVFKNKATGDLLSFSCRPHESAALPIDRYSDTALEIFPRGLAVWTQSPQSAVIDVISMNVSNRRHRSEVRIPTLEYCFTTDIPEGETLMAHGRAWFQGDTVVFVQHTSDRAISAQLVRDAVSDMTRSQH